MLVLTRVEFCAELEAVRAAVLLCPNYLGRWVDGPQISSAPERANLPIRNLSARPTRCVRPAIRLHAQMLHAITVAQAHGYKNVTVVRIEGKAHERLAEEVLAYFASLL